jgi:hypothetical protein
LIIGPEGRVHPEPKWDARAMSELAAALRVIRDASQLKTPGLAESTIKNVLGLAQKELGAHLKEGGVVVLG